MTDHLDRIPHYIEAERALCAALIRDQSALIHIDFLSPYDFHDDGFRKLFAILQTMHDAKEPISDQPILERVLCKAEVIELIGGTRGLAELFKHGINGHELYYALEIRKAAELRKLHCLAGDVLDKISDPKADPGDVASFIEAQISSIGHRSSTKVETAGELARKLISEIESGRTDGQPQGVFCGLFPIDTKVGAFMPGELIIVAALTSIGKTSFATQIAEHVADHGTRALIVSVEMKGTEVIARMLAADSGVSSRILRSRNLSDSELAAVKVSSTEMERLKLAIWAPPSATVEQIRAVAKLEQARRGLGLLVVDYVGRLKPTNARLDRHEQVSHISGMLKTVAGELNVPVLALVQLNREAAKGVPRLSHLAESASLERDADIVLFLHRQSLQQRETELIVAKHRNGPTGAIPLTFNGATTRFDAG